MAIQLRLFLAISLMAVCPSTIRCQDNPGLKIHGVTSSYYFPFACAINMNANHQLKHLGTGAILTTKYVIYSVESLVEEFHHESLQYPMKYYYAFHYNVSDLIVVAGMDGLLPLSVVTEQNDKYLEIRFAVEAYLAKSTTFHTLHAGVHIDQEIERSPIFLGREFQRTDIGLPSMDTAIIRVEPFTWSTQVLPMPISTTVDEQESWEKSLVYEMEENPESVEPCVAAGWGRDDDPRMVFYELVYVRFDDCLEAVCQMLPSACMKYPVEGQHVCFKPVSYGGPCGRDQGTAVYCSRTKKVFAFLVKSFECGFGSFPAIYSLASFPLHLGMLVGKLGLGWFGYKPPAPLEKRVLYGDYENDREITTIPPLLTSEMDSQKIFDAKKWYDY